VSWVARVVLSPTRPLARARGRWPGLSTAMKKYHLMMMSHCKG
jgi:hypothetical protein